MAFLGGVAAAGVVLLLGGGRASTTRLVLAGLGADPRPAPRPRRRCCSSSSRRPPASTPGAAAASRQLNLTAVQQVAPLVAVDPGGRSPALPTVRPARCSATTPLGRWASPSCRRGGRHLPGRAPLRGGRHARRPDRLHRARRAGRRTSARLPRPPASPGTGCCIVLSALVGAIARPARRRPDAAAPGRRRLAHRADRRGHHAVRRRRARHPGPSAPTAGACCADRPGRAPPRGAGPAFDVRPCPVARRAHLRRRSARADGRLHLAADRRPPQLGPRQRRARRGVRDGRAHPAVAAALLGGAALGLSRAIVQAVCRNPLAEPGPARHHRRRRGGGRGRGHHRGRRRVDGGDRPRRRRRRAARLRPGVRRRVARRASTPTGWSWSASGCGSARPR